MRNSLLLSVVLAAAVCSSMWAQYKEDSLNIESFWDSAHHWYDINDEVSKLITPLPDKPQYDKHEVVKIAENILLYQRANGGWIKNYDMRAILTEEQKQKLIATKDDISLTTFDNGTTHSQVEYLARAYTITKNDRFKESCLKGIDFILSAQYPNGGFPQFYPDTKGYRKYITFNDGAMIGVMKVLHNIVRGKRHYSFIDETRRKKVKVSFEKGIDCILRCQIVVNDTLTAWCQQHDHVTLQPQNARSFEPKAICSMESAEIVQFLMSVKKPKIEIVTAVNAAVRWFRHSMIHGIKIETIKTAKTDYIYHNADFDKVVVHDTTAPPIWTRMYEIETNRPLFCRRDGKAVYTLAEVEPERRTGYKWYGYEPQEVIDSYQLWYHSVAKR
ncbi:MAG: pectate lyase [Bacteroidota bacterium]